MTSTLCIKFGTSVRVYFAPLRFVLISQIGSSSW